MAGAEKKLEWGSVFSGAAFFLSLVVAGFQMMAPRETENRITVMETTIEYLERRVKELEDDRIDRLERATK
jgi:hypothetical protein